MLNTTLDYAKQLDKVDELRFFRDKFNIPKNTIYVDGNSLGLQPKEAEKCVLRVLEEWKTLGIRGWLESENPWFYLPEKVGNMCAELVGAEKNEVIVTASTTVNIHSVLATFFQPNGNKKKILADSLTFPSDIYAIKSFLKLKGLCPKNDLILIESKDGRTLNEEDIVNNMTDEVALVFLPSVLYRSGQLLDIAYLTKKAHEKNIFIGFDCCHSVGAVPHSFSKDNVDFAVWCSYKYLNSGPGASAFIYINKKHFEKEPGLTGWFGYKKQNQFDMIYDFNHQESAGGWQISTPNMLSLAPIEGSLNIFKEASIQKIRKKSKKLTSYFVDLINSFNNEKYGYSIVTPLEADKRSGHIAISHKTEAWRICEALKERGVVPDFRHPDVIRIAPIALYNTFEDVWTVANILKQIIDNKDYEKYSKKIKAVS